MLDLGSGGGIDVLLSARRVGPSGFAYGVDMTDEMLTLARASAAKAGAANAEFRKGEIEALPLPGRVGGRGDLQDCVINLSADKPAGARRDVPRAGPGRADRHHGRGRRGPPHGRRAAPPPARTPAASPAPCPALSTSTGSPRPGLRTRRSPSPARQPRACTRGSSGPPSPPPHNGRAQPGPLAGLTGRRLPSWPGLQVPPRGLANRGQAPGDDLPPGPTCRARRYRAVPGRLRGQATGSGDGRQARRQAPDAVG